MNSNCISISYPFCTCERERISYNTEEPPILTLEIQHMIYNSIISGEEYEESSEMEVEEEDYYTNDDLQEEDHGNNNIDKNKYLIISSNYFYSFYIILLIKYFKTNIITVKQMCLNGFSLNYELDFNFIENQVL